MVNFCLGYCVYMPKLKDYDREIDDESMCCPVILGPGTSVIGDLLWNFNEDGNAINSGENRMFMELQGFATASESVNLNDAKLKLEAQREKEAYERRIQEL